MSSFLAFTAGAMAIVAETPHTDMPAARQAPSEEDMPSLLQSHIMTRAVPNRNTAMNTRAWPPTDTKPASE